MADHSDSFVGLRDEVAYVCQQLERLRAALEAYGADGATPLERLIAALRAGENPSTSLERLHQALLAIGDAAGVHGGERSLNPIGAGPTGLEESVLLCPMGRCSRYSWPDGLDAPNCHISDQPLRTERL